MKFGKVLTYHDVDEARKLIGKKVIYSDVLQEIETKADALAHHDALASKWGRPVILTRVVEGTPFPFRISNGITYQFIREVIDGESEDPHYEPYDLSDKKVRDSLRWRRFRDEDGNLEQMVTGFEYNKNGDEWLVNGIYTASTFLRDCVWIDEGTPCGRRMD
jgi:hypothetical protein